MNKLVTRGEALGRGLFSGARGWEEGRRKRRESDGGEGGRWKKSGKDVMAVVKSGGKCGVLEAREGKGGGGGRGWWEEAGKL